VRAVLAAPVLVLAQRGKRQIVLVQQPGGEPDAVLFRAAVERFVLADAAAATDFDADAGAVPLAVAVPGVPAADVERQNLHRLFLIHGEVKRNIDIVMPFVEVVPLVDRRGIIPGVVDGDEVDLRHRRTVFVLEIVLVPFQQVFAEGDPLGSGTPEQAAAAEQQRGEGSGPDALRRSHRPSPDPFRPVTKNIFMPPLPFT